MAAPDADDVRRQQKKGDPVEKRLLLYSDRTLPPNPSGGADTDMEALERRYAREGYQVRRADAGSLPDMLGEGWASLVLVDSAYAFPAAAVEPLKRCLQRGARLITVGGYAFYEIASPTFDPDPVRRCISVSSPGATDAHWVISLTEDSPALGGSMAGITGAVRGLAGFEHGENLVVKFFMKSQGTAPGGAALTLSFYRGDTLLEKRKFFREGEGWQYVYGRVSAPPGLDRLEIAAGLEGSAGKVSFDDLHIGVDHYTRVYDCGFEDSARGWSRRGEADFAVEPREKEYYLSSRFADQVEDYTYFRADSIPLFDLEARLSDAVRIEAAPGQPFFGEGAALEAAQEECFAPGLSDGGRREFAGWSAIAPTGGAARWQPLLLCRDSAGVDRGYAGALLRCYPEREKGQRNTCFADYAGFAAAFFGVTNCDLFAREAFLDGLMAVSQALLGFPWFESVENRYDCYRPGEASAVSGTVCGDCSGLTVGLAIYDEADSKVEETSFAAGRSFSHTFSFSDYTDDFYTVRCVLTDRDGRVLDRIETGFVIWQEKTLARGPRLHLQENLYFIDHGPGTPRRAVFGTGADDVERMRSPDAGPLVLRREFLQRRDLGILVYETLGNVRSIPQEPFLREQARRAQDAVVALCSKYGQIFMMGLAIGDNVACSGENIQETAAGIRETVTRYRDCGNILFYLNGDFSCRMDERTLPVLEPLFHEFLRERYPDDASLALAWGEPQITRESAPLEANWPDGKPSSDRKAQDYNFFRYFLQNRWVQAMTEAVHSVDPTLPCLSEYYETPKFSVDLPRAIGDHDISNIGCFCHFSEFSQRLAYADQRFCGKGFGIGEYGKRGHPLYQLTDCDYMRYFPQEEVRDTTVHYLNASYAMGASHCHVWCAVDFSTHNFPWGLVRADRAPRDLAYWVRNFSLMSRQGEAEDRVAPVALMLPDNTRSAANPRYQGGHFAATQAIGVLQHLCGRVMTLNECRPRIPEGVRAIFYPVAFCPPQKTLDALFQWVENGGVLYVSGDLAGDGDFYGRGPAGGFVEGRLERLLSLRCQSRRQMTWRYPKEPVTYTFYDGKEAVSRKGDPCLRVCPLPQGNVRSLASDQAGEGVIFAVSRGKGQVIFNTDPSESFFCDGTLREDKALYRMVLRQAGLWEEKQVPAGVEDVKFFSLPLRDGGRVLNLENCGGEAGCLRLGDRYVLSQQPFRSQVLREDAEGRLTGVLCQGELKSSQGISLLDTAYAYVLSQDGLPLARSEQILILPQQAGEVELRLPVRADAKPFVLLRGQITEGTFRALSSEVSPSKIRIPEYQRNWIFLLCRPGEGEAAVRALEGLLL